MFFLSGEEFSLVADRERIGCCDVVNCEVFSGWDGLSYHDALKKATRVGLPMSLVEEVVAILKGLRR